MLAPAIKADSFSVVVFHLIEILSQRLNHCKYLKNNFRKDLTRNFLFQFVTGRDHQ